VSLRSHLSPPDVGPVERALLLDAFDSNWIAPLGPYVERFERELQTQTRAAAALATCSGTAALDLAYRVLGIGAGDLVACSTLTFIASVGPAVHLGARPLFIDAEPHAWCMDAGLLQEALDEHQGAIAAVTVTHAYGQPAHMDAIRSACQLYGVPIIEDAAAALGATYRDASVGILGDLGIFSFNGNKIITTGGGGALVTGHRTDLVDRARHLATQAREPGPQYLHQEVGFNYRLSNLLAAVGQGQLMQLPSRIASRRAVRSRYQQALQHPGIRFQGESAGTRSNAWLTGIVIDPELFGATAEDVWSLLQTRGFDSRPLFLPLHRQPCLAGNRVYGGSVAEKLNRDGLCLPSGSSLGLADQQAIISTILEAAR